MTKIGTAVESFEFGMINHTHVPNARLSLSHWSSSIILHGSARAALVCSSVRGDDTMQARAYRYEVEAYVNIRQKLGDVDMQRYWKCAHVFRGVGDHGRDIT